MKKIFTLIIAICSMATVFAQWQQGGPNRYPNQNQNYPPQNNNYNQYSSLTVGSRLQQQLTVSVDNNQYQANGNNGNGNNINVGQLQAGNHNVVISQWRRGFLGKQVQQVIYNSSLYFKPGYETNIFVDAYGHTNITERQLYADNSNQGEYNNNGNGVGYGYGRKKNKHKKNKCDHDDHGNNNNQWNKNERKGDDDN